MSEVIIIISVLALAANLLCMHFRLVKRHEQLQEQFSKHLEWHIDRNMKDLLDRCDKEK